MKKTIWAAIAATMLLPTSNSGLKAQNRWGFEFRAGVAAPTADLVDDELGTGVGFEGLVTFRALPHLATYAGWDWWHFNPDDSFAGPDIDVEETGYAFGLRFAHPFRGEAGPGAGWWLRAGALVNHIEFEDDAGELVADTGHGLGWEVGAGLGIPLGGWTLTPGVRFRSLTREAEFASTTFDLDLRAVHFGVGVARRF